MSRLSGGLLVGGGIWLALAHPMMHEVVRRLFAEHPEILRHGWSLRAALESQGAGFANVVEFTTYMVHSQDIPKFMAWRQRITVVDHC